MASSSIMESVIRKLDENLQSSISRLGAAVEIASVSNDASSRPEVKLSFFSRRSVLTIWQGVSYGKVLGGRIQRSEYEVIERVTTTRYI